MIYAIMNDANIRNGFWSRFEPGRRHMVRFVLGTSRMTKCLMAVPDVELKTERDFSDQNETGSGNTSQLRNNYTFSFAHQKANSFLITRLVLP